ncbi:MAG: hypothetical protein PHV62_09000 [Sulfuricurvum sp.]|nr:hypothetical protein [Sulfuricurvum sp.]
MQIEVATSWQNPLLDKLKAQTRAGNTLQIYGALPAAFPTGRPDDVPKVERRAAVEHFQYAKHLNIETNYLINGAKGAHYFSQNQEQVREYFSWVTRCLRPDLITISDPELQIILNKEFGWVSFCISAIAGIEGRRGIKQWQEVMAGFGTVRSLVLHHNVTQKGWAEIREVNKIALSYGIRAKLMMTESCYGGCKARQLHYAFVGQGPGSRPAVDAYQVACMSKRLHEPASLLDLAGFITPEELHSGFAETGIEGFKITGRSCSAGWVERACSHYFSGRSPQNLFEIIVLTSPFLREALGMELDQLFYLDSEAYNAYSSEARHLGGDERTAFRQSTAIKLFETGLLKINDPGAVYSVCNGNLKLDKPGQYATALQLQLGGTRGGSK